MVIICKSVFQVFQDNHVILSYDLWCRNKKFRNYYKCNLRPTYNQVKKLIFIKNDKVSKKSSIFSLFLASSLLEKSKSWNFYLIVGRTKKLLKTFLKNFNSIRLKLHESSWIDVFLTCPYKFANNWQQNLL